MATALRIARTGRILLAATRQTRFRTRSAVSYSNFPTSPRPHTLLEPRAPVSVPSHTDAAKSYIVTRVAVENEEEYYTCSCMAWTMQKGRGLKARTCKHLKRLLGEESETARLKAYSRSAESINQNTNLEESDISPSKPPAKSPDRSPYTPASPKSTLDGRRHFSTSLRSVAKKATATEDELPLKPKRKAAVPKEKKEAVVKVKKEVVPKVKKEAVPKVKKEVVPKVKKEAVPKVIKEVLDPDGVNPNKREVSVLLAKKFELGGKISPVGYWVSEKLDGIRAFWDGDSGLWSRVGNRFHAPDWFLDQLPQGITLDGELYHSRGNFSSAISIVRSQSMQNWEQVRYKVFDIPFADGSTTPPTPNLDVFETRMEKLDSMFDPLKADNTVVDVVPQRLCMSLESLVEQLKDIEQQGGEGLMLREARSLYVAKRSSTLLKVKTFFDAEAIVIGYEPGKGKYAGQTGSLVCRMESGREFSCGSGMIDSLRVTPPPIGAIITYRFQEMTKESVPRFPVFVGERIDAEGPKDADVSRKSVPELDE